MLYIGIFVRLIVRQKLGLSSEISLDRSVGLAIKDLSGSDPVLNNCHKQNNDK